MRIISGKLKGKSIAFLKSTATRPLKDSVKENIFNILAHSILLSINLEKSNVLLLELVLVAVPALEGSIFLRKLWKKYSFSRFLLET